MRRLKSKHVHKGLSKLLQTILLIVALVVNLMFVLSLLSSYLSGRILLPAVLGLIFPLVFILEVIVLLYWTFRKKWIWAGINLILLIFSLDSLFTYMPMHGPRESIPITDSLKVISYNVNAFDFVSHKKTDPNPILKYLKNSDADIIFLQEAHLLSVSLKQLKSYLKEYDYIFDDNAQPDRGSRLMVISKWPIIKTERISYPSQFNGSYAYWIAYKGREILAVNNHLESFRLTREDQIQYKALAKNGEANELWGQAAKKLIPAYAKRALQADEVHRFISNSNAKYVICVGDFNDTPISYARHRIADGLKDAFKEAGKGPGFSFNFQSKFVKARIDHIMHSKNILARRCYVDNSISTSDHYPIVAILGFQ